MTSTAKAKTCETPVARQKRVWDKAAPGYVAAVGEMRRVLAPGGRLLLLDHIASTWPPLYAAQWLAERTTIRTAGEHFTRRQLPLVTAAGFQIAEAERLQAGTVERIHAVKPA